MSQCVAQIGIELAGVEIAVQCRRPSGHQEANHRAAVGSPDGKGQYVHVLWRPSDRRWRCPVCGVDVTGHVFDDSWFKVTGGHPGDSGPGGNTPQDPTAEGWQTCPHCEHEWEICG